MNEAVKEIRVAKPVSGLVLGHTGIGDPIRSSFPRRHEGEGSAAYLDIPRNIPSRIDSGATRRRQGEQAQYIRADHYGGLGRAISRKLRRKRTGRKAVHRWPNTIAWGLSCGSVGIALQVILAVH